MKNLHDMKKKWLTCCGVASMAFFLTGCAGSGPAESFDRSDYYTRGIGVYPGSPAEDFSPAWEVADDTYRNVALLRTAYHSSSYDYNLTAQLVTDGIVTDRMPPSLRVSTPAGDLPRREREWTVDGGPYSRNTVMGEDTYLQYTLNGWSARVDRVAFTGRVAFEEEKAKEGYAIVCQGSNDGQAWTELGRVAGPGLPGKVSKYKVHTDPNKVTSDDLIPACSMKGTIELTQPGDYAFYRVVFQMKGAAYWTIMENEFSYQGERVDMLPSQLFSSSWMSASAGEEWIYVDLGCRTAIDQVNLHWVNKAVKGHIQLSADGKQWKEVAALPGGTDLEDIVSLGGTKQARYVRVWMEQSADGNPYVLSELEVMGRGGVTLRPADPPQASEGKWMLSGGNWLVQRASEVKASGEAISTPDFAPEGWVVATVPGTVLTSYKNVGAIPNPNYADNLFMISESFFNSNFWYRDEFELPTDFRKECLLLHFDGINWKANVYLNGKALGRIEGAFMRGAFDVTDALVAGKNVLAVEIIKNDHIGAVKEKNELNTDFNGGLLGADNPTFHASIGWDWISTIRGRNIGIWNDVYLTSTGVVTVEDPFVQSELPLPDTTSVRLTPEVIVTNHAAEAVTGVLTGRIGEISFEQPVELAARESRRVVFDPDQFTQLRVEHPRLWWPKGYGAPNLYEANFTFRIQGTVSDARDFQVGIRQMTFDEQDQVLRLYINGRRFIGRGGNWGFGESNLNYRGREYDVAVAYHADMNFTMMRNWVGQIGDQELYEACDRHGILIWQDFWLANPSDGPDPYDEEMFIANAADYVKRYRSHASIGLYCGRNEGYPPEKIDKALRQIVAQTHPGIHYISSSADEVVSGHGPYRALPAKEYFTLKSGSDKFHSERGMPNVMNYESLVRTFSPDALWPQNGQWGQHDYTMEGAQSCASFNAIIEKGFGKPANAKEFADWAQWVNYDGYRAMFESRSLHRKGLLLWMTHPAWPSMVWQTYDYYFEPTAAYFGCKKASEPLHVQWNPATDQVEVVNYSAGTHRGLRVKAQLLNMDATVAWEKEATVDSEEDTTVSGFALEFPTTLTPVHYVKLTLSEGERCLSDNFYLRGTEEGNYQALQTLPKVKLKPVVTTEKGADGTWHATVRLKNESRTPALLVRLNVLGATDGQQILPMFYGDNYFSLMPGEEKEVTLHWQDVDTRGEQPKVVVSAFNE
ncbi:MAG: glycosyl hydrolase 2 galactose-binding domain-containing protein [Parabacteroides sp.]